MRAAAATLRLSDAVWQTCTLAISMVVLLLALWQVGFQFDFKGDLYAAGLKILHGVSPYRPGVLQHQAAVIMSGGTIRGLPSPRWPMPILLLGVPLGMLPTGLASACFMLLCVVSVVLGLRLLGVRDGRCVLIALVSAPTALGVLLGNISPILLLGIALVWRLRHRLRAGAATTALVVLAKVLFWPLGLWMLMTCRRRNLAWVLAIGVGLVAGAWATIGFADLSTYPQMLLDVAKIGEGRGASLTGFFMFCGFSIDLARALALSAGGALLGMAWSLAKRPGCERNSFGLLIIAALTMTPVVWSHYFVLLFVPIALVSPRLSALWFLPSLAAFAPGTAAHSYGLWVLPILIAQLVLAVSLSLPMLREIPALDLLRQWRRTMVATARAAAPS